MARKLRGDAAGVVFHVFNRGRGKRPIFLDRRDYRFFLSLVARAVRRGEIKVYALVLMTNHFHLVVLSCGRLSEALRRIENEYSRYYNERYSDEGALFRSRFDSKPVEDLHYLRNVIRYCDDNPLEIQELGITAPREYEWGSAFRFARARRPRWLSRAGLERAGIVYGDVPKTPRSPRTRKARRWLIHARLRSREEAFDPLSVLLSGGRERVRAWLSGRAAPSGAPSPSLPVAGEGIVEEVIAELDPEVRELPLEAGERKSYPTGLLLTVGLLRDLSVLSFPAIAERCGRSVSTTHRLHRRHCKALTKVPAYLELACEVVEACVDPLRE